MDASIAGMTFTYFDEKWCLRTFPLCVFDTENIGKSIEYHEVIISAAIKSNDKFGPNVLIFPAPQIMSQACHLALTSTCNLVAQ